MRERVAKLIEASYSSEAAAEYLRFKAEHKHLEQLAEHGKQVLTMWLPTPLACVPMSAMWKAAADHFIPDLPAYQVAGELYIDGTCVFGASTAESIAADFDRSSPNWDGHSWIVFGDHIGDVSLFRTAYSTAASRTLREKVLDRFGTGRGLLIYPSADLQAIGIDYRPRYVLTDQQVTSCCLGARYLAGH